ncbi:hypothetical protein ACFVIM_30825 [Streptomyces sp. NPDC057638]|uniref:hypothetical protein n=1 Tax=Streptomyces sp. NPDC057638 TaxID=3346190 RepID=UPI0036C548BC
MPVRHRLRSAAALIIGGFLLIGAAGQLAKMAIPDATPQAHKRLSEVAPILIGGFLIGAAPSAEKAPAGTSGGASGTVSLAMNKAELVG